MITNFDIEKLDGLLEDFYTLTKIRITVFNDLFQELTAFPKEPPAFCRLLRAQPQLEALCRRCDKENCAAASKRRSTYVYICHAGLTEAITPIYAGDILVGYLLFGNLFSYVDHNEGWQRISSLCRHYEIDFEALRQNCFELPITAAEYIRSASHILQAVASYLCMENMAVLKPHEFPVKLDRYIHEHLSEELSAESICSYFQVSRTKLYETAKKNYGSGVMDYIRLQRIEKAKALLLADDDLRIKEVASSCGFSDYNYFITVFRKLAGMPPTKFRLIQ